MLHIIYVYNALYSTQSYPFTKKQLSMSLIV